MQLSNLSLALTAVYGSGFAWRNLFADGTPGFRINIEEAIRLNQQARGVEQVPQPLDLTQGWLLGGNISSVATNSFSTTASSGVARGLSLVPGKTYELYLDVSSTGVVDVRDSAVVSGTAPQITSGITTGAPGRALFTATSGGVYIRVQGSHEVSINSLSIREIDLSKCVIFQDSAGTLPVMSMEQPLGLILDTKFGVPVRGPELIANGDFSNGLTGWSKVGTYGNSYLDGNSCIVEHVLGDGGWSAREQSLTGTIVPGRTYVLEADITLLQAGQAFIGLWIGSVVKGPGHTGGIGETKRYRWVYTATATTFLVRIATYDGAHARFDNISVREVPGNHFVQPSNTASRPIVSRRVNLLTATETLATQNVTTLAASHVLTFSGTGSVTLSGTATGTYSAGTHTITTTAGTLTATVSGSVTNADLRLAIDANLPPYQRVTSSTDYEESGFPAYAKFDGVDDWLESGVVDMTSTDEVTVIAGVTKLSDAAAGTILEFGHGISEPGRFNVSVATVTGDASRRTYGMAVYADGTEATGGASYYASPDKRLIVALFDTKPLTREEQRRMRLNGVPQTLAWSGGILAVGNFGAQKFYMGRRGGTQAAFNGRIYGVTVVGKLLTDSQLAAAERAERNLGRLY